jgi:hypothetical protein
MNRRVGIIGLFVFVGVFICSGLGYYFLSTHINKEGSLSAQPVRLKPYNTDIRTETFINYIMEESVVELPTYHYSFRDKNIKITFSFDGDDKYGHYHYKASIDDVTRLDDVKNIGLITSTNKPDIAAVYTKGSDMIFVWDSFSRFGASSTPHRMGFIIYNPILGSSASKEFEEDDGSRPFSLSDYFDLFVRDNDLYVLVSSRSGEKNHYLLKDGDISIKNDKRTGAGKENILSGRSEGDILTFLYGNYDEERMTSDWFLSESDPDWEKAGIGSHHSYYAGNDFKISILAKSERLDSNELIVMTGAISEKLNSTVEGAIIGAFLFRRDGGDWRLISGNKVYGLSGKYGRPPIVRVVDCGRNKECFKIVNNGGSGGDWISNTSISAFINDQLGTLFSKLSYRSNSDIASEDNKIKLVDLNSTIEFIPSDKDFYDIKFIWKGIDSNIKDEDVDETIIYSFNNDLGKYEEVK